MTPGRNRELSGKPILISMFKKLWERGILKWEKEACRLKGGILPYRNKEGGTSPPQEKKEKPRKEPVAPPGAGQKGVRSTTRKKRNLQEREKKRTSFHHPGPKHLQGRGRLKKTAQKMPLLPDAFFGEELPDVREKKHGKRTAACPLGGGRKKTRKRLPLRVKGVGKKKGTPRGGGGKNLPPVKKTKKSRRGPAEKPNQTEGRVLSTQGGGEGGGSKGGRACRSTGTWGRES